MISMDFERTFIQLNSHIRFQHNLYGTGILTFFLGLLMRLLIMVQAQVWRE